MYALFECWRKQSNKRGIYQVGFILQTILEVRYFGHHKGGLKILLCCGRPKKIRLGNERDQHRTAVFDSSVCRHCCCLFRCWMVIFARTDDRSSSLCGMYYDAATGACGLWLDS